MFQTDARKPEAATRPLTSKKKRSRMLGLVVAAVLAVAAGVASSSASARPNDTYCGDLAQQIRYHEEQSATWYGQYLELMEIYLQNNNAQIRLVAEAALQTKRWHDVARAGCERRMESVCGL